MPPTKSPMSRRAFARRTAFAAAAVAGLPGNLIGVPQAISQTSKKAPSPAAQAEIEATVQAIFRRYGDRLSDAQKADIRRLVTEGQKPLQALRAFPLDNANQPGNVLKLYPDPAGAARSTPGKSKG